MFLLSVNKYTKYHQVSLYCHLHRLRVVVLIIGNGLCVISTVFFLFQLCLAEPSEPDTCHHYSRIQTDARNGRISACMHSPRGRSFIGVLTTCDAMASTQQKRGVGHFQHAYLQPSPEFVFPDNGRNDNDNDNATTIIDNDIIDSTTTDSNYSPRLSRSPHPYYRISSKIANRERDDSLARSDYHQASDSGSINDRSNVVQRKKQRNSNRNGNGWSRTSPRASSESGTEADDESTGLLKGLPAPPVRSSRKGLRSTAGRDDPLLWLQDETPQSWSLFVRSPIRQPKRSSSEESMRSNATFATVRGVVARRKRNEVMRRVTETALLLSVGVVVLLREDARSYASSWHKGGCFQVY